MMGDVCEYCPGEAVAKLVDHNDETVPVCAVCHLTYAPA